MEKRYYEIYSRDKVDGCSCPMSVHIQIIHCKYRHSMQKKRNLVRAKHAHRQSIHRIYFHTFEIVTICVSRITIVNGKENDIDDV